MLSADKSQNAVAETVEKTQNSISLLWIRFQSTGCTDHRPFSWEPRVTAPRLDRQIRLCHLQDRFATAVDTVHNALGNRASPQPVHNRLKHCGLKASRPYKGTSLTNLHKTSRRNWARRLALSITRLIQIILGWWVFFWVKISCQKNPCLGETRIAFCWLLCDGRIQIRWQCYGLVRNLWGTQRQVIVVVNGILTARR